jgi:hypothetical protein
LLLIRGMQDEKVFNNNSNVEVVCTHHFLMINFDVLLNLGCLIIVIVLIWLVINLYSKRYN